VRALLEEGVAAPAVTEVVVLPGFASRSAPGRHRLPVEEDFDRAEISGEVPGIGVRFVRVAGLILA